MITITPHQYAALAQVSGRSFIERLANRLATDGHSPGEADAAAHRAWDEGRRRGLSGEDEIEAFAQVLATGHGEEPAWSREIIDGSAPRKAERLRRCLSVAKAGSA